MSKRPLRKLLSLILAVAMVVSLLPAFIAFAAEDITVAVTVEKFTVDGEFIVEPMLLTLPAGSTAAQAGLAALDAHYPDYPNPYGYGGTPSGGEFYLSRVYDPTYSGGSIPAFLAEMDEGGTSGWMITVANYFIDTGAGDRQLADGEVVRWQYSCEGLGADIGGGFGGDDVTETADKDALIYRIAEIKAADMIAEHYGAYVDALAVLKVIDAPQDDVDAALAALMTAIGEPPVVTPDPETEPEPEVPLTDYKTMLDGALARIIATVTNPKVGITNGEWAVLALARAEVATSDWAEIYYASIADFIASDYSGKQIIDEANKTIIFDSSKYTENSRVIIALNALGVDARDVYGYDLVAPLSNKQATNPLRNQASAQGVNGSAYALIALDSGNYETADKTVRGAYLTDMLARQLSGGGWTMFGAAAPDLTSMVIQALSPYYNMGQSAYDALDIEQAPTYADLVAAVDKAVAVLSARQEANGAYGSTSSEYLVQTVLGLSMIGIDVDTDPRFIKNDVSLLAAMNLFRDEATGGFENIMGRGVSAMSTEQAAYALVGYDRFKNNAPALYDFSDVVPLIVPETPVETYTLTVRATTASSGTAANVQIKLYEDNDGVLGKEYTVTEEPTGTRPKVHTFEVPAGTYAVRGTNLLLPVGEDTARQVDIGGVSFEVDSDTSVTLYATAFLNSQKLASEGGRGLVAGTDFTMDLAYANGRSIVKGAVPIKSASVAGAQGYGVLAFGTGEIAVTFTPLGATADEYAKTTLNTVPFSVVEYANLQMTAAPKLSTLTVPTGATVQVFTQTKNYVLAPVTPYSVTDNGNGTTAYRYTAFSATPIYRVSMPGKVTVAGYAIPATVTFSDKLPSDTTTTGAQVNRDNAGVLLNINEDNHLALNVGDDFKLRSFRAPWQVINGDTTNIMIEPDFHYTIISGDDVISITPDDTIVNWAQITALKSGTAVVEVTYDALDVINGTGSTFYGATDPQRKGTFVVTVGETSANVDITVEGKAIDSEFDTFYMLGDRATYAIDAQGATLTAWNPDVSGSEQTITDGKIVLYAGSNIVKAETASGVTYKILRAVTVTPVFTNVTRAGDTPAIGDTVKLHFDGIAIPMPKMSGIYNPGFGGTLKLYMDGTTQPTRGVQYTFPADNNVTFVLTEGVTTIGGGYIQGTSMGDEPGNHRNITDDGRTANMSAGQVSFTFGFLPQIDLTQYFDGLVPTSGFTVALAADKTAASAGEEITVDIVVTGGDFGGFNVAVEYDTTKLTLVSATDLDGQNGAATGNKVAFLRNGDAVAVEEAGNTIATLVFAVKSDFYGDATAQIKLVSGASVVVYAPDEAAAPKQAKIQDGTVTLALSNSATFDITLPSGATDITGVVDGKATHGMDVAFKLAATDGYTLTVTYKVGNAQAETLTPIDGVYTIAGAAVTGEIVVTATKTLNGTVELPSDGAFDGSPNGSKVIKFRPETIADGVTYLFDGNAMYWSAKFGAYMYIADSALTAQEILAKITSVTGGAGNETLGYKGEIDQNAGVSVQDAQIVYALYTGGYPQLGALSVKARLEADVNGDGAVDMLDVRMVQAIILGIA